MEQSSLFRAISLDKTLTQLQQQIELASKIGNYTFINEIAIENFIKNVIIINNNNNDESLLLFDKQYRNHINSLLSYLVYLFETNSDSNKQWLIHLMVRKFFDSKSNIDDIISNVDLKQKIRLLADQNYINLSIICSSKLPGLHPYAIDFYRRRKIMTIDNESLAEDNEIIQSLCVKLRNSLFQDPRTTAIVMNILAIVYDDQNFKCQSKTNYFEKIYSQALIHTLKNQNRQLMLKILLCCPDSVFDNDDDDNLIKQIIDCLRSLKTTTTTTTETTTSIKSLVESELVLMSLYSYGLFAHSKRFIQFIADISHQQRQYDNLIIDSDHRFFNLKQSFLLAVEDRKHFLRTFIDYYYSINLKQLDEMTISLSLKSRIILTILSLYHIINNHEDSGRMQEKISKIETNLCSMFEHLNHHQNETNRDEYFIRIVNKLDFVFKFADWCCSSSNSNNNNNLNHERSTFRLEIIAGLMTGTTPLKILSNYNFFHLNRSNNKDDNDDQLSINNDNICDNYICDLIEHFDHNMAIILKGFIIIRLVFSCIFFANDRINFLEKFITNISNRLQNLLQELNILEFRMEIMENLFCLLFLTKNDLKINDKNNGDNGNHHCFKSDDDEDYLDETISPTKSSNNVNNQKSNRHKSIMIQSISNFSTANFICPNWLIPKLLEVLETMLYKTNSDLFNSSKQQSTTATNDDNEIWQENLKRRISRLLEYVSDARFRYDVIRPAFFRQTSSSSTATTMMDSGLQSTDPEQSQQQQMDYPNRHYSISTSSENDYKQQTNSDTSLISCMLASYQQLLCYTLAENRLDSSRQIAKLFANDLKNSKPYKELQLLDYFLEFHQQVCNIQQKFIDHSSINYQHHHDDNNEIGNNNNNQNRLKIDDITTFGIRSSCIQSLLYEMLMKMDTIEIETKIIFMLDYALSSSPSLEIAQSILESVFINNNNLFEQFKQSSSSSLDETNKILPEKVENFINDIQKFIKNLGQHIDISQISLNEYLEKSLTLSSFMDVKIFIDTLQIETELCRWYYRFQSLLIEIEHQIIDDPDILLNSEQNQLNQIKSNDLNHIYDRLMANCPLGKYQYMKALYYYVCKVNNALVECRKRDIRIIDDDDNKHNQTIDTSMICSSSNFSILKQSPSAILCSMVIKNKISPKIIDDLAQVMKVNLIGVLCSVFCPTIPSTFLPQSSIEFTITELCQPSISELIKLYFQGAKIFHQKLNSNNIVINDYFADERQYDPSSSSANINDSIDFQPIINQDVLNYFHSKCPILVEILRLLDWLDDSQIANITNIGSTNVQLFDGSPIHRWLDLIRKNFHYNDLRKSSLLLAFYARIPAGQNVVIKTLEHYTANRNFIQVYRLFRMIEDFSTIADQTPKQFSPLSTGHFYTSFQIFQNAILACLAFIKEDAKYIFQIHHDPRMKAELILCLLDSFEIYEQTFYATRLIRLGLQNIRNDELNFGIDVSEGKSKLTIMLKQIEFYASVGQLTGLKSWKSARNNLETIDVLTIIKTRKRYSLAIDWFDIHGFENDTADLLIELLIYAYSEQNDYIPLKRLFQRFLDDPKSNNVIIITEKILNQTENLDLRIFLIDFLIQFHRKCGSYVMIDQYERHRLGIEMVRLLSRKIQSDYLDLIPIPLLIVEQLLMNSEIESLDRIINQYKLICADDLVEKYAQKSVYIELYDSNSFDGSDMTIISSDSSMMMAGKNVQPFFIPQTIPSKDQWVSDQSKTHCMLCQIVRFGMINRRHHCRRCGRIVCNGCSSNAILIIEINPNIPVRVCDDCFNWSTKIQTNRKISTNSLDQQQQQSMNSNHCRTQWKLSIVDDSYNQNRRSEFSYESSPSVSLCLAILRLHSNKTKSCKFIIDKICAPLIETISSRNVDSTLLIEMIRSLLISTRVAFDDDDHHSINNNNTNQSSSSSSSDIEQLNRYLDRLDVIRMLINANYGSKEMIGLVLNNNIQKLQEKLLEAERFELTIDIAKKYGYEYSSIWKSWALISLKYFHFAEARQKFGRYFDQVKRFSDIQKTLHMIIETLVSVNSTSLTTISIKDKCSRIIFGQFDFFTDTTALAHNTSNSSKMVNNTNISTLVNHQLKPRILQEIVYYLETYGSKDDQLQFYVSHFYWKEAIDSFLRQPPSSSSSSSSTNVKETKSNMVNNFLEKIFIPAQINGHLSELFAAIRLIDPKQQQLGSSLIHICKYLDRNESFHTLYRVQIFMNDYLRAAITQINHFFLSSTILFTNFQSSNDLNQSNNNNHDQDLNNFELLFNRISYLEKAKDYCNMYLHNFDFIRLKRGCLSVDKKDVYKQIRLIELQIDILRRFRRRKILFPVTIIMNNDNVDELENQFKKSKTYRSSSSTPLILSAYALAYLQRQIWQQFSSSSSLMEQTEQKSSSSLRLPYPPTLLEHDPIRKSLITGFVILYYGQNKNISSSTTTNTATVGRNETIHNDDDDNNVDDVDIEDGFRCALRIIQDHHLNEKLIFRMCTMFLIAQHLERNSNVEKISNDLRQLLSFIQPTLSSSKATINVDDNDDKNDGNNDNKDRLDSEKISISSQKIEQLSTDDIIFDLLHFIESIMTVLIRLSNSQLDPITIINGLTRSKLSELKESIIKLIVDDNRRIDAYLQVGKLKLAYLLAAQLGLAANIEHVLMAARNANDQHYVKICEMWLKKNTATTMI